MTLEQLLEAIKTNKTLKFAEVLETIKAYYDYTPTFFTNSNLENPAGTNEGSCIIFSFAKLHQLTDKQTLQLFGEHYQTVIANPKDTSHANIRQFIKTGLTAVSFKTNPLKQKA